MTTYETERKPKENDRSANETGAAVPGFHEGLRLGQDVRFVLACVGGGAIRIGQSIARRHLRYVETIAINCDTHVQEAEEFDRRVFLGPETGGPGDTRGSPVVGGILARAAGPVLDRLFEGATFVTVIGSLGGGSGTGSLPFVLEAAARSSEVLSVFVVKPFACEGERRALADRALARLHFVGPLVEKQERGVAKIHVLDNEGLRHRDRAIPFNRINAHWSEMIAEHIEHSFVLPAEAAMEAARWAVAGDAEPMNRIPVVATIPSSLPPPTLPIPPLAPHMGPLHAMLGGSDAELTFEVLPVPRGLDAL
ncbi:MAG: hypothetical protein L3J96_02455 [Thermoplasmata archaeon]|nr:hypothetical protein [Thermoplasmata archaeon]